MRGILATGLVAVLGVIAVEGCGQQAPSEPLGKQTQALSTGVVISAVYGGGASATSTYKSDYVELFNRGATPVSLTGWALQYSRNDFRTWDVAANKVALSGTIPAGGYYLIKLNTAATGLNDLPTSDATGTTNAGTQSGLFALTNDTTTLNCGPPPPITVADAAAVDPDGGPPTPCTSTSIVDLVGYGKTGATPAPAATYEGTGAAPTGAVTSVIKRKGEGCTETDDNNNDFELVAFSATVVPRNSSTALNLCAVDSGVDASVDTAVVDVAVDAVDAPVDAPVDVKVDAGSDTKADAPADVPAETTPADTGTPPADTAPEDTGSPVDTGTISTDTGTATADTGTPAVDEVTEDDGCGCRVAGGERTSVGASLVGMFFALGAIARRRRK